MDVIEEHTENGTQYLFNFDFFEQEQKAEAQKLQEEQAQLEKELNELKRYADPQTDNEKLFNLQWEYYHGNAKALQEMFLLLDNIAQKLVNKECKSRKLFFTKDHKAEIAIDATTLFIEQIIKNSLKVKTSFIAYLFLQIRKEMYNRTHGQLLEAYCIKNNISLFDLTDEEKKIVKSDLEWELLHPKKREEHSLSV